MAIHSAPEVSQGAQSAPETVPIDIEAWTEEATAAMSSVTISAAPAGVQGPSVTLQIPLDDHPGDRPQRVVSIAQAGASTAPREHVRRREPLRRDSLKRREALLKGKEGSRRRQRWENDRLLNNPWAQPPLPSDWAVHPTYPVHNVPYFLAPLWDAGLATRSAEKNATRKNAAKARHDNDGAGQVPKELREKLKRSRGAKGLLMDLEGEVRSFVEKWEEKEKEAEQEGIPADPDSEDDEIVFVGRNGTMNDMRSPVDLDKVDVGKEMLLFDSALDDQGASFGRFLLHHIGAYYGLRTWSITVGDPARREAYIGLKDTRLKSGRRASARPAMPRPLWGLV